MAVMLETIGSFVLAMMITLSVLRLQFNAYSGDSKAKATYILQIYAENVRRDLRKAISLAGYDVEDKASSIVTATTSNFVFKTDMNSDGTTELNSISVSLLPTTTTPKLANDQLIRFTSQGRTRILSCRGLVGFQFSYFNSSMASTTTASAVRLVHFKFRVSTTEPVTYERVGGTDQGIFALAWVEDRVFPKNLLTKY